MRLRQLTIAALPGITPGFTFEPPDAGVVLVSGPNAVGKSSLARALKHLLGGVDRKLDPPALSLEATFDSGGTRWQVRRNGSQIQWLRDGEAATAPSLPSGDQINLYRLSMESLLVDDQDDQALAERTWRDLRGGFDLDAPRTAPGRRWGRAEERALLKAHKELSEVERHYAALQADEGRLPDLERRLQDADQAREHLHQLQQALELHEAIERRKRSQEDIDRFPDGMDKLKGDELQRLEGCDAKAERLIDERKQQRRELEEAQREQKRIGFQGAAPDSEQLARIEGMLQTLANKVSDRKHALNALTEAEAARNDALAQFQGAGEPPDLSPDSLERALNVVEPLIDAQARLRDLRLQLDSAGKPPDESQVEQLRDGVSALRAWLAVSKQSNERDRLAPRLTYAALALAAIAAVMAFLEQAFWSLASVTAAGIAMLWATVIQARPSAEARSPKEAAKADFEQADLDPPQDWSETSVRAHLRHTIEPRLNELTLRQRQAEGAAKLSRQAEEVHSEVERLQADKTKLAAEIGIDPELAGAPFHRFIDVTGKWDQARRLREEKAAVLNKLETEIVAQASKVRAVLSQWRQDDAPPFDASGTDSAIEQLRIAWQETRKRLQDATEAQHRVASCQKEIRSLESQRADIDNDVRSLFQGVALEAEQRDELRDRIARREDWQAAGEALRDAERDEREFRAALAAHDDLIAAVEGGDIEGLEQQQAAAQRKAQAHTTLIEERKGITTRLEEAGRSQELERAAGALDNATATLEDKREAALRHQAAAVLLDEVEGQFTAEHEPDLLRRAKERFEQVTAHEFSLELRDGNRFAARDRKQGQLRTLEELSSGTRMQLLLALRLAWTEAQEQGGESLPLFLDEALTTSDENRFAVMANTLGRLADAGDRQIFYLSARRHESALWRQATGTEPPTVDLAQIRFGTTDLKPADFQVDAPPSLPPPTGQDAASYAAMIGVRPIDPQLEPGGIHLFHLLRDDLELLHRLMGTWRIATLGQLESLLASNAAQGAVSDALLRWRLSSRCQATRIWTELWHQGRGRPVNRAALEQSGAVSPTFIDRTAELAHELDGDGTALITALREHRLPRFQAHKTDELAQWLADEGYTDDQSCLSSEDRHRLTLATAAPQAEEDAVDCNQLVSWLERATASRGPT